MAASRRELLVAIGALFVLSEGVLAQDPNSDDPVIARVYERQIRESERRNVQSIIFSSLLERYANDKGIKATDEEIRRFRVRVLGGDRKEATRKPDPSVDVDKIESDMAREMILTWKTNLALFRDFGGRIIFQQMGPEPVDAYRDFLLKKQKEGEFELIDGSLGNDFWNYFTTSNHTFISKTREEGEKALSVPFWEQK